MVEQPADEKAIDLRRWVLKQALKPRPALPLSEDQGGEQDVAPIDGAEIRYAVLVLPDPRDIANHPRTVSLSRNTRAVHHGVSDSGMLHTPAML